MRNKVKISVRLPEEDVRAIDAHVKEVGELKTDFTAELHKIILEWRLRKLPKYKLDLIVARFRDDAAKQRAVKKEIQGDLFAPLVLFKEKKHEQKSTVDEDGAEENRDGLLGTEEGPDVDEGQRDDGGAPRGPGGVADGGGEDRGGNDDLEG